MLPFQKEFIDYALTCGVLKFGEFQLKSGRISPYFFNTGLFNTGASLGQLGKFYAQALQHAELKPDVLYGPAYKGIPLVSATAIAYANLTGQEMPFAFNRKEVKDHGEGGLLVGSALQGKVVIVDDVISAGLSVKESIDIIQQANAQPCGVLIALNRQEKGAGDCSAVQEVEQRFSIPVVSIINLANIIDYLSHHKNEPFILERIQHYQAQYGA